MEPSHCLGYQSQIEEMERFMKQTWEDKERDTQRHEARS